MKVTVANGQTLSSTEICRGLQWQVQGLTQHFDFLELPLMGCDLILGVQWLSTLGLITWDFKTLKMQFKYGNATVSLRGLKDGSVHIASKK